jgi:hypothetical protein
MISHHGIANLKDNVRMLTHRRFDLLFRCARLRERISHRQGCARRLEGGDESKGRH